MPEENVGPGHSCPECGKEYVEVKSALACWLEASPDALRSRSLRTAGALLSCSYERVRQSAHALGVDTSLASKEPGFLSRAAGGGGPRVRRPRKRTEADKERAKRAQDALRADPVLYEAYLERRRRRHRDRWRNDPEFRRARTDSLRRWRLKTQQKSSE
jgi:hypothetical protein